MNRNSGLVAVVIGVLTATIPTVVLFQAVTFLFFVPLVLGSLCIILGVIALRSQGKFFRHAGWVAGVLMLVAVIPPFGLIAYHRQPGYPIVLVVPEGYRGPVRLVTDRQAGIDVSLTGGKYTYHIPPSGTLRIKDDGPFRRWHVMTATYSNGKSIPIDYERTLPPDAVSLHFLGSGVNKEGGKNEKYSRWFVGTAGELRKHVDCK